MKTNDIVLTLKLSGELKVKRWEVIVKEQRPNLTTHKIKLFTGANLGTKKVKRDFTKKQFQAKYVYLTLLVAFFRRRFFHPSSLDGSENRIWKLSKLPIRKSSRSLASRLELISTRCGNWTCSSTRFTSGRWLVKPIIGKYLSKIESDNFVETKRFEASRPEKAH